MVLVGVEAPNLVLLGGDGPPTTKGPAVLTVVVPGPGRQGVHPMTGSNLKGQTPAHQGSVLHSQEVVGVARV